MVYYCVFIFVHGRLVVRNKFHIWQWINECIKLFIISSSFSSIFGWFLGILNSYFTMNRWMHQIVHYFVLISMHVLLVVGNKFYVWQWINGCIKLILIYSYFSYMFCWFFGNYMSQWIDESVGCRESNEHIYLSMPTKTVYANT